MTFKKNRRSKLNQDSMLCQFLYFICDVIFDKLSELQQIPCIIPHKAEIQDSSYWAGFSINHNGNWYKWRVLVSKMICKRLETGAPLCRHFPKFFKSVSR